MYATVWCWIWKELDGGFGGKDVLLLLLDFVGFGLCVCVGWCLASSELILIFEWFLLMLVWMC